MGGGVPLRRAGVLAHPSRTYDGFGRRLGRCGGFLKGSIAADLSLVVLRHVSPLHSGAAAGTLIAVTASTPDDRMAVEDVRTFVPAMDFARSKAFYEAIGWSTIWTDGEGLALMDLAGHRFMLQDYYVKQWLRTSCSRSSFLTRPRGLSACRVCLPAVSTAVRESPSPKLRTEVRR